MKRSHLFALMVVLSFALMWTSSVPGIEVFGRVLLLFSTLFHELGHGIATLLVGGEFDKVSIHWDASGETLSRFPESRWRGAIISAGGLVGPSIAAAILFWSARGSDNRLRGMAVGLGAFLLFIGVFKAGWDWALVFTAGLGPLLLWAAKTWKRSTLEAAVVFIAVQLGISVFSRSDYLFTKSAGPGMLSDVAQMSNQLFLPFWFWGLLCGGISLVVLFWGFRCYTKED